MDESCICVVANQIEIQKDTKFCRSLANDYCNLFDCWAKSFSDRDMTMAVLASASGSCILLWLMPFLQRSLSVLIEYFHLISGGNFSPDYFHCSYNSL